MAKKLANLTKFTVTDLANNRESRFAKKIFTEVWITGDVSEITKYYAPDVKVHFGADVFGMEMLKQCVTDYHRANSNVHFIINEAFSAEDLIITLITEASINAATQTPFILNSVAVMRIKNKRLQETWVQFNAPIDLEKSGHDNRLAVICRKEYKRMYGIISTLTLSYNLSQRELECLVDLLNGLTAKETAKRLKLSFRTIESYLEKLKAKLGCLNRQELRQKLFPRGLWL